ncbi:MAG: MATE family efflux transporter, partial [Draconibacterium sp.]
VGSGLAMATTALVSRRIGEKKQKQAGVVAFQAILVGAIVSVLIAIPGVIFAKDFLRLMGGTEEVINEGYMYPAIMFGGNLIIMLLFIINAVFRSSGDAAISMRVMWLANIINIILDPLLIFGYGPFPELGVTGAAIATTIGRGIAVIYQFYLLWSGKYRIKLYWDSVKVKLSVMWKLLRISGGGILQNLIATSSWILLMRIIAVFGADAIAGYTIAIRIVIFTLLLAWGLSNAAATLVGQNLGANHPERAERSVWIAAYANVVFMGIIGALFVFFPDFWIGVFVEEGAVMQNGILSLRIISLGFLCYAMGMVLMQAFNGSSDTITPTKINFFVSGSLKFPSPIYWRLRLEWDWQVPPHRLWWPRHFSPCWPFIFSEKENGNSKMYRRIAL